MPDTENASAAATSYDLVAYPPNLSQPSHPDRLAALAVLAGLDPVPPEGARILEVGAGDGLNLLSHAATWPGCEAHAFDLSAAAVAKGREIVDLAGMTNASVVVEDILKARERYAAGSFDYVIVHGVYAWVPPFVAEAIMDLVGHVLSPRGLAMISYNAMPGGHVRQQMREMLLMAVEGIEAFEPRMAAVRAFLERYAEPLPGDDPLQTGLRAVAKQMLDRPMHVLFHDELGEAYHPQRLDAVVAAAAQRGLRHLTDAGTNLHLSGFLPGEAPDDLDDPDGFVLRAAQLDDYWKNRFFRQTVFVRREQPVDRLIDLSRMCRLHLANRHPRNADGSFGEGEDHYTVEDEALANALDAAARNYPQRVALADIARTPDQLATLLRLFNDWSVTLHPGPAPFAARPGARPTSSPLVRGMLKAGRRFICTLNHTFLKIEQPEVIALLLAADGTRSLEEVARAGHGIPPQQVEAALTMAASKALLLA